MTMEWDERYAYAKDVILPWIARSASLDGFVVEFGCGNASVTAALAGRTESVLGLDIDAGAVEDGRTRLAARGVSNVELVSGLFDELVASVEARRGEIDLMVLFAVLEHMTIEERLRILATARDTVSPAGAIAIVESPNRLLWWDYHTSVLPFFGMLPDELALLYATRSERPEFVAAIAAANRSSTALTRWGRGVSFHEFELVFEDFPDNVVGCNYEPELFTVRELHPEELYLAHFLSRTLPSIPPSFSRYYIDLVMASDGRPVRYIEPWPFETTNSAGVEYTGWETLLLRGPGSRLIPHFAHPTDEIVLGLTGARQPLDVRIHAAGTEPINRRVEPGANASFLRAQLDGFHENLTIDVTAPCHVNFLGIATERERRAPDGEPRVTAQSLA